MKTKKFVIWQLKKWAPMFIVFALIPMVTMWPNELIRNVLEINQVYEHLLLPAFVLPFFVFSERFNKNAADAFKAFPTKKNEIRITKMLLGAVYLAILTFIIYWFTVLLNLHTASNTSGFGWHFLSYLYISIAILSAYFFNCTMVSFGNTLVSSFFYVSCGTALLSFGLVGLLYIVSAFNIPLGEEIAVLWDASGVLGDNYILLKVFSMLIGGTKPAGDKTYFYVVFVLMFLIRIGIGALSFFLKEPSGEYYAMPGARNEKEKSIFYTTIGLAVLCLGVAIGDFFFFRSLDFLFTGLMCITVYIYMVIFNKRFSLTKVEGIVLGSLFLGHILIKIIASF